MFSRQFIKIAGSARTNLLKKYPIHKKYISSSCLCLVQSSRSIVTTARCKYAEKSRKRREEIVSDDQPKQSENVSISTNNLLEKLIAGLSADLYQKNRVYKNDLVRVISKVKEINFSTKKQGLLLIHCCTELLPDESSSSRMGLVEQIWNVLKPHTNFTTEHYNELLSVYIANNRTLQVGTFITQMSPVKPNITTYELILKALGQAGDINQATEVLSNMKAQGLPANERIFNSLITCQGRAGNLQNIDEVLSMMISLKLEPTIDTYTAIACAFAWNKKPDKMIEEMEKAVKLGLQFEEIHIMEIVKTLASNTTYVSIPEVLKFLPHQTLSTPSISPYMQSVCTLLVFQNHPIAALEIYKCLPLPSFGPKDDQGLHGRSLVRDCVKASLPASVISLITQELMSSGRNPIALHNASEAALQQGKVPLALDLFTRMQQLGMPLRPHYFWPILLYNSKTYGEKGIMNTLSTMNTMDVKPDYDTIMEYTLPFVSFTSPQNLMKKFLDTGLNVTTVLTPMMQFLLNTGQVRAASEICELFQGKVDAEKLIKPLLKGYLISSDVKSTVYTLEDITKKATDKNKDWIGRFLCAFMHNKKVQEDLLDFMNLLKALKAADAKISPSATDCCITWLPQKYKQDVVDEFRTCLADITDESLVDDGDMFVPQMPHPRNMNEESLSAHLTELEAKGMNSRGVLRKLLQQYCREGNIVAAKKIVEKCEKEGVFLSAGMKASIFDLHVKLGELDQAELALADLNKTSPNFTLDEFKVIDFATLMVYSHKIDKAYDLITEEAKKRRIIGGRGISMNCWRLMEATASQGTPAQTRKMFDLLYSLRYCTPINALLGPLVRVHLKKDHLEEAVKEFARLSEKYKKTPLKHELLCKILMTMSEGQSEDNFLASEKLKGSLNKLVQTVLNIDKSVHGAGDVPLTLIAALADVGYKKSLRKVLLEPSVRFHPDALYRRCERFADEKNVDALETLAACAKELRHVDVAGIYDLILDVHQRDDNCTAALALWDKMVNADVTPSQKFVNNICALVKANNKELPAELAVLQGKQAKKDIL